MDSFNTASAIIPPAYGDFECQYIGGLSVGGTGKNTLLDSDPYTGKTLAEIPGASQADVDRAFRAAHAAQPAWENTTPAERSSLLLRAAQIMERRQEEIVGWLIRESGSTRIKATLEWHAVHAMMTQFAAYPYQAKGEILPSDVPGKEHRGISPPAGRGECHQPMELASASDQPHDRRRACAGQRRGDQTRRGNAGDGRVAAGAYF